MIDPIIGLACGVTHFGLDFRLSEIIAMYIQPITNVATFSDVLIHILLHEIYPKGPSWAVWRAMLTWKQHISKGASLTPGRSEIPTLPANPFDCSPEGTLLLSDLDIFARCWNLWWRLTLMEMERLTSTSLSTWWRKRVLKQISLRSIRDPFSTQISCLNVDIF